MKFTQYLINERFVNLISDDPDKEKYVDQVWDLLQYSYRYIGGIKGSGFSSKEDMIKNIPFWKLAVNKGKVEALVMYKDKGGRKSVAVGATGSDWSIAKVADMMKNDIERSFGEKSKGALGLMLKQYPFNVIEAFLKTPKEAEGILKKGGLTPISDVPKDQWPADAVKTLEKYPKLKDYGYLRELAGKPAFKVMIGTSGQTIR
jgi:hypothetical protein